MRCQLGEWDADGGSITLLQTQHCTQDVGHTFCHFCKKRVMFGYAKVQLTVPACLNSPVSPKTYDAKNSDKFKEILSLFSESVVDKFWCCMLSGGNLIGSDVITCLTQLTCCQPLMPAVLPDWARRSRAVVQGSSSILLHSDVTLLCRRSSSYPAFSI